MKKFLIALFSLCIIFPLGVNAETEAKDLKETVESIDLSFKGTNYKETKDQVVVYLFRWKTCEHCHDAIEFFNDIVEDYGDKFKMRSFETSLNPDNKAVQKRVSSFLNLNKEGVPLIVIGESYFYGFSNDTKEKILQAIDNEYNSKEKYDIFEEMDKPAKKEMNKATTIAIGFLGIAVVIIVIIFFKKK